MTEFFQMGGNGAYVWSAYGITLAVLVWNAWAARSRLRRMLREAADESPPEEQARRPTVSRIGEQS